MAKPVPAQVLSAEPSCNHDYFIPNVFAFKHAYDDHTGARFTVVVLERALLQYDGPAIVRCFCKLLAPCQSFDKVSRVLSRLAAAAGHGVFGSPITDDIFKNLQTRRSVDVHHDLSGRFP